MTHGIIACEGCGKRIGGCRCMEHNQTVKQGFCDACKSRPAPKAPTEVVKLVDDLRRILTDRDDGPEFNTGEKEVVIVFPRADWARLLEISIALALAPSMQVPEFIRRAANAICDNPGVYEGYPYEMAKWIVAIPLAPSVPLRWTVESAVAAIQKEIDGYLCKNMPFPTQTASEYEAGLEIGRYGGLIDCMKILMAEPIQGKGGAGA